MAPFDDFLATVQAIPAVAGQAFPLSQPASEIAESNSTAPLIAVLVALLLVAGGTYWYVKK